MTPKNVNIGLKIILGLMVVGVFSGLFFANKTLTSIAGDTAKQKAEIDVTQKQIDAYSLTKIKVESLDYVNELAQKVLPAEEDQSTLVAELNQFALRSNLTITQLTFADAKVVATDKKAKSIVPSGVSITPITLGFGSGVAYKDLLDFLKTLETNQRKTQLTNIVLTPDDKDRSQLSQVSVQLNVYTKKASKQAAPGVKL